MGRSIGMCIRCGDTYPSDEGPMCGCRDANDWKARALKADAERDELKAQALASEGQAAEAYAAQKRAEAERDEAVGFLHAIDDEINVSPDSAIMLTLVTMQAVKDFLARMDKERE